MICFLIKSMLYYTKINKADKKIYINYYLNYFNKGKKN